MNEPLETKGPLYIYSQQKGSVYKVHCWHTCMSAVAESRVRIPAPCKYVQYSQPAGEHHGRLVRCEPTPPPPAM